MNWLQVFVITVFSVYTVIIFTGIFVLLFSKKEDNITNFIPTEKISVIIPFRNEAQNIITCLEGIIKQDYPSHLLEVFLMDDHSEDNSGQLAENCLKHAGISYKIINLKDHNLTGKKNAIELAVSLSTGSIIITRDADTYTPDPYWLKSIARQFKIKDTQLVIAPVILSGNTFIQAFQQFENMAITCLGYAFAKIKFPFVCSGANLAYKKESFLKADPYKDNKQIASGDDMFLLQSFLDKRLLVSATRCMHALVYTNAEKNTKSFLDQRLRWASKGKNLHIKSTWLIGTCLFLSNLALLIMGFCGFFGGINYKFCLFALLYKCIIEFLLLFLGRIMYKQKLNFIYFLPAFVANILYIPAIALASVIVKPTWKGRKQGV